MRDDTIKQIDKIAKKDTKKNGTKSSYIERTNYLAEKYRSSLFFIFLQFFVIIFLTFGYLTVKKNTVVEVVLPKVIKDSEYGKLKIGIGTANELYYRVWGGFIAESVLNINKDNLDENINILKKMMLPSVLKEYSGKIRSLKKFVIDNRAVMNYSMLESSTVIKDGIGIYKSKGVVGVKLGKYKKKDELCHIEVKMQVKNYMLFITSFVKQCEKTEIESGDDNVK